MQVPIMIAWGHDDIDWTRRPGYDVRLCRKASVGMSGLTTMDLSSPSKCGLYLPLHSQNSEAGDGQTLLSAI